MSNGVIWASEYSLGPQLWGSEGGPGPQGPPGSATDFSIAVARGPGPPPPGSAPDFTMDYTYKMRTLSFVIVSCLICDDCGKCLILWPPRDAIVFYLLQFPVLERTHFMNISLFLIYFGD